MAKQMRETFYNEEYENIVIIVMSLLIVACLAFAIGLQAIKEYPCKPSDYTYCGEAKASSAHEPH